MSESVNRQPPSSALPKPGRLAGIDFGTVRIGIAICDAEQTLASPLETYQRITPDRDALFFRQLAEREQLVGWVIGLPIHLSGASSQKSAEAEAFGTWLARLSGLPIAWVDERFTTAHAHELLSASGLRGRARKSRLDKIAAQIILAVYLESGATSVFDSI